MLEGVVATGGGTVVVGVSEVVEVVVANGIVDVVVKAPLLRA